MTDVSGINSKNIFDTLGIEKKSVDTKQELGQSEFFELMVAQMKNQDPLKPETNGDFLAQLAQFKTSDGITNMQKSLDSLTGSMQSNQALQASSLVGRSVLVPGNTANFKAGGEVSGIASLPASARNIMLDIYGSNGNLVKHMPLGTHPAGDMNFTWDGTDADNKVAPDGQYKMVVSGLIGQQNMQFGTHIAANVDSVSLGQNGQGMKLNVEGLGQLNFSEIKQIGE